MDWEHEKKLSVPCCPSTEENQVYFYPYTADEKVVADYANITIAEVDLLPYADFLLYKRDGYIHDWLKTEWGRKYLEDCWIMGQTKPDRATLREQFGKRSD